MNLNFRPRRAHEAPEINLIPMIDVLLVVLIFLMISTSYSRISALRVALPSAATGTEESAQKTLVVGVSAGGDYSVNRRTLTARDPASLSAALSAEAAGMGANEQTVVIVHADAQTSHQSVVQVMEAARAAGLSRITFATQAPPNK